MKLRISYELDSALVYRQKNRIFGNIDNRIRPLSASEIVIYELERYIPKVENLFDRDLKFYEIIK